jgi:hypothetical protein
MVLLGEIILTYSEHCDEAADATLKLKLYLRSIDLLMKFPHLPIPLKLAIGISRRLTLLMKAAFIRTMTTDRPEAVQTAFIHLSEANDHSECVAKIVKVGTGFDSQSKREDDTSISLDLALGGTRLLYCCSHRYHYQCE